jgi:hypothetical protein
MNETTLFLRPAPWGIGPGPRHLHSIDEAISAIEMWLVLTPDIVPWRALRQRMLVVLDILERARSGTTDADLASAKLALKGLVRYARTVEQRRGGAGQAPTVFNHVAH